MSLKPPQQFNPSASGGLDPLAYELAGEMADALGRAGRKVEKALETLKVAGEARNPDLREALLDEAADLVWSFFIQREICGLRNQSDAIRRYGIPGEVLARLGRVRRPAAGPS